VLALLILPAVLLYPSLSFHLLEPDESRYAEIPREMLQRGDLVVPVLQGEPYLDKPPLQYWLVAASYRLFGVSEAAARLPSALAVHATLLLVYLFGRRLLGERSALAGALTLLVAPGFVVVGRLLILDGLLTFWTTLALFALFEALRGDRLRWGWWLTAAAACGFGVLTKGPVALMLVVPPIWLHRRLTGGRTVGGARAVLVFAAALCLVALPWYVALCWRIPGFLQYFFWEHNVVRFLSSFAHQHGVWFYVPVLLLGLLPATLLLLPFLRFLGTAAEDVARRRPPELGLVLLAGGWCAVFFSLSSCKLPTYLLPALPPFALAFGHFLISSRSGAMRMPLFLAAAAYVLLALTQHVVLPWYAAYRSPMGRPEEVRAQCGDPAATVVCYPRNCDSVSFYLRRDDLRAYRSKDIEDLRDLVRQKPRTVILCTRRHSLADLDELLPPEVGIVAAHHFGLSDIPGVPKRWMKPLAKLMGETALGLADIAIVERLPAGQHRPPPERRSSAIMETDD
jgi:4-amino-4-deoxy-L-arabinose transferase-like glycosyltransferase